MKKLSFLSIAFLISTASFAQIRYIDGNAPVDRPSVPSTTQSSAARVVPAPSGAFDVSPRDGNIRLVLSKWSRLAGWTFEVNHWTVSRDVPVVGSAALGSDFKQAVSSLLASTELTDLPLQPCFYSNNVLRVVPLNELCTRVRQAAVPTPGANAEASSNQAPVLSNESN